MPRIGDYRFGRVTVEGRELTRDVIVLPGRVVENWRRRNGHELVWDDLTDVVDELPPRLVVGMGADLRMRPHQDVLDRLLDRGVDVECLPTPNAVVRFAGLDPSATAAALHLTC